MLTLRKRILFHQKINPRYCNLQVKNIYYLIHCGKTTTHNEDEKKLLLKKEKEYCDKKEGTNCFHVLISLYTSVL